MVIIGIMIWRQTGIGIGTGVEMLMRIQIEEIGIVVSIQKEVVRGKEVGREKEVMRGNEVGVETEEGREVGREGGEIVISINRTVVVTSSHPLPPP